MTEAAAAKGRGYIMGFYALLLAKVVLRGLPSLEVLKS